MRVKSKTQKNVNYKCLSLSSPQLCTVDVLGSRSDVLYVSCGLIEKHELRIGKVKDRDQEGEIIGFK